MKTLIIIILGILLALICLTLFLRWCTRSYDLIQRTLCMYPLWMAAYEEFKKNRTGFSDDDLIKLYQDFEKSHRIFQTFRNINIERNDTNAVNTFTELASACREAGQFLYIELSRRGLTASQEKTSDL